MNILNTLKMSFPNLGLKGGGEGGGGGGRLALLTQNVNHKFSYVHTINTF
jgi:hypothetical protein